MARFTKGYKKKVGLPSGSLIYIGEKKVEHPRIKIIDFSDEYCMHKQVPGIEDCTPYKEKETTTWINIDGLHDVKLIESTGKLFDIHPLVLEDILHTGQRPKIEEFDDYIFLVFRMISYDEEQEKVLEEQLSIVLGENYVISFQEEPGDMFDSVRERIIQGKLKIRRKKADYLVYALLDTVVDNYFQVLDKLERRLEELDGDLFEESSPETFHKIGALKKEIIHLRKSVWPLRETVNSITKGEYDTIIDESNLLYFRDVYDHIIHVIDILDNFREMIAAMHDTYMNFVNSRMNEVMKILTVIATMFIPLTFIAGVYGMNFRYMPELEWQWGYFGVLGFMGLLVVSMIFYFKRKNWF
ncbi:MAG: magnesium/cobalt transporter CorA [Chlorobiales bacterium]|nr:magnesium/cobalt transporter CorA [Chlorobiales bacterium]